MESINYYTLNKAQHFYFPHDTADTYSDEQLWSHYIGEEYLCVYLIKKLGAPVQPVLKALETHKDYACAWMRLKFLCEVMEPSDILRKRNPAWQKGPLMKEPCVEIWNWTAESLTERYYKIDVVTNIVGQHLFDTVKAIAMGVEPPKTTEELTRAVKEFNAKLYAVRGQPLEQLQWNLWNPRDLAPYAWALYLIQAWSAFSVFLPSLDALQ